MSIVKLNQQVIDHELHCPGGKTRIELCDRELPGLYVEVRSSCPGQGTYYLRYKVNGRTSHAKVGRSSEITLAEARKKAKQLKAEIALGANPRGEAKAQKEVPILDEFFEKQYLPYVTPRKRSWKRDEELYRLRIQKVLGGYRLNQITRKQIQTLHTDLLATGLAPATCDHHLKLIRQALNLAIDWQLLEKNPAVRIPLFSVDNKKENYVDAAQLERLMNVLRSDANRPVCLIALFLLSTGARLNEALSATWANIDRDSRVWRIPASNSKSKKIRSVPLNDSALEVLAQLDTEGKFEHVFVNMETKKPYTTIAKVWLRLRAKAGLPHLRLHDLRHSYASMLVNAGRTLYEVQQILGHSDTKVTERYAHLSSKTLQDAANSASMIIKGAMPVAG